MAGDVKSIYLPGDSKECERPIFMVPVSAGFPSPAEDYIEGRLDLNKYLVKHPSSTFFVRVAGDSMINAGIHPDDLLIVDRSLEPVDKRVVIAVVNGDLTVKRIRIKKDRIFLVAENETYAPIDITLDADFQVWGVVTSVIHAL